MATVYSAPGLHEGGSTSVGQLLRRARERRGLSLQEIARQTKLPSRHLEALEQDNLAVMPAAFYQRAEIRAYAQAVGLDQKLLLSKLDSALKPAEARGTARETARTGRPTHSRAYVLVALGIVAVSVLGYAITQRARAPQPAAVQPEHAEPGTRASAPSQSASSTSVERTDAVKASDVNVAAPKETVEPPPPAGAVTELVVTTEPAGARVTVNGIAWGVSPVTIHHLPAGDKRIRVTREGYAAQERVLRLDPGRPQALDILLESAP
jgi:cytoskeleton protein RodZ